MAKDGNFWAVAGLLPENPLVYLNEITERKYGLIGSGVTADFPLREIFQGCEVYFENATKMYIEGKRLDIKKGVRKFGELHDSGTGIRRIRH